MDTSLELLCTYHSFRKSGEKIRECGERIYRFFQGDAACLDSALGRRQNWRPGQPAPKKTGKSFTAFANFLTAFPKRMVLDG